MRDRQTDRQRERQTERDRERDRERETGTGQIDKDRHTVKDVRGRVKSDIY